MKTIRSHIQTALIGISFGHVCGIFITPINGGEYYNVLFATAVTSLSIIATAITYWVERKFKFRIYDIRRN